MARALAIAGVLGCFAAGCATTGYVASYPANPRYFADAQGKPLLLLGDYAWGVFSDVGYNYEAMFDEVSSHGQNLARVWLWWGCESFPAPHNKSHIVPYLRPGPGTANDGLPKYDLDQFNPAFFERLQRVCKAARDRGITLQLMFFDAWMIKHDYLWRRHAYCRDNNINGVDGDPGGTGRGMDGKRGFCSMGNPGVLERQKAYMRRVMDAAAPFDNVFFEIANENFYCKEWETHLCEFIHDCEKDAPRKHLVMPLDLPNHGPCGIQTYDLRRMHREILKQDGLKQPIIYDTDGLLYPEDSVVRKAMWTAFVSGVNADYLDESLQPDGKHHGDFQGTARAALRDQLGYLSAFAHGVRFWEMAPADGVLKEGFGFVLDSARETVVYLPEGGAVSVEVAEGRVGSVRWFNPRSGEYVRVPDAGSRNVLAIRAPTDEDWTLWVRKKGH